MISSQQNMDECLTPNRTTGLSGGAETETVGKLANPRYSPPAAAGNQETPANWQAPDTGGATMGPEPLERGLRGVRTKGSVASASPPWESPRQKRACPPTGGPGLTHCSFLPPWHLTSPSTSHGVVSHQVAAALGAALSAHNIQ